MRSNRNTKQDKIEKIQIHLDIFAAHTIHVRIETMINTKLN